MNKVLNENQMSEMITVLGALGNVGAPLVDALIARKMTVRATHYNIERVTQRFGDQVEACLFDFDDPSTISGALKGTGRLFLIRPPQITNVEKFMYPVIDKAREYGIKQIVFLSLIGIENNQQVPHYKVEQYIKASGIPYTMIQPGFFMQNLSTTHLVEIRDRDEIFVPVGLGKTAFIDIRDIAEVIAQVLAEPGHENKSYELTGNEAVDYYEVAEIFSKVLNREIVYTKPSVVKFLWKSWRSGTKLPFALVMTWLYNQTKNGMGEKVTPTVENLLKRPPISMQQFVADYAHLWQP